MHPVCIDLGFRPVYWYGVMMMLGFLAGLYTWYFLGRSSGRDFNYCSDLVLWIAVAGIAGARIAHVLSDLGYYSSQSWWEAFAIHKGGLIYYGGFLASGIAILLFAYRRKESALGLFDFVITAVPLAHVLGRIGCFLNGCCFGKLYNGVLSVTYPYGGTPWYRHHDLKLFDPGYIGRTLSVYPVQLYEAAFNLGLYLVLLVVYKRRKYNGGVVALYLLVYPAGRFLIEFMRGDERMLVFSLTVAQAVSVALFLLGLVMLWLSRVKKQAIQ